MAEHGKGRKARRALCPLVVSTPDVAVQGSKVEAAMRATNTGTVFSERGLCCSCPSCLHLSLPAEELTPVSHALRKGGLLDAGLCLSLTHLQKPRAQVPGDALCSFGQILESVQQSFPIPRPLRRGGGISMPCIRGLVLKPLAKFLLTILEFLPKINS